MSRLVRRAALIAGTAGGQGRAAALLFAREGATVVGCDLNASGNASIINTSSNIASRSGERIGRG